MRYLTLLVIVLPYFLSAQETDNSNPNDSTKIEHQIPINPNSFDELGRKTGKWTFLFDEHWNEIDSIEKVRYYKLLTFKEGKPIGIAIDYYLNGQVLQEASLISYDPRIYDGDRIGYSEEGNITFFRYYVNGEIDLDASIKRSEQLVQNQKELGSKSLDYTSCQYNLAELFGNKGQYAKAESLYRESLNITKEILGNRHPDYLYYVNRLAWFYQKSGQYLNAELLYRESLNIRKEILGNRHPDYLYNVNSLAFLYEVSQRYAQAEPLRQESVIIAKETYGDKHELYADALLHLAWTYERKEQYTEAETLILEGLSIIKENYGEKHEDYIRQLSFLGENYLWQKEYDKAESLFSEVMALKKESFFDGSDDWSDESYTVSMLNIANLYEAQGEIQKADSLYRTAMRISKEVKGERSNGYRFSLNDLAIMFRKQGQYDKAEPLLLEKLRIDEEVFGERHPFVIRDLVYMGGFYHQMGKNEESTALFLNTMDYYLDYMENMFDGMGENDREQFYVTLLDYFETFKNFAIEESFESPEMLAELYNLQLSTKSILLNTSNQIKRRILESNDRRLIDLFDEVQTLKQIIGQNQNKPLDAIDLDLDSLSKVLSKKDRQLSEYASYYAEEKKHHTWKDVRSTLEKGEAAIEIIRIIKWDFQKMESKDSVYYAALIVTPKTKDYPGIVIFPDGNDLEQMYIHYYRNMIGISRVGKVDSLSYDQYWSLLKKNLKGIKTIYFSPDGVYNSINLETLYNPKTRKYLMEEVDIRLVTSTNDLLDTRSPSMPNNYVILMGNPDFGQEAELLATRAVSTTFTLDSMVRNGISSLPGTKVEIETLQGIFSEKGWREDVWMEQEATEEKLKNMLKPKVLHIATHGFFELDDDEHTYQNNPLYRSGLLLSGAEQVFQNNESVRGNTLLGKEDGVLTAFEAMNLNIENTELVALSACETGLGEIRNGEGVYGLQRAFQVAGARSLLISLWKVSDQVTQELMVDFYTNWLGGMSKREALKKTQLALKEKYESPFYWGAFVLVGE